MSKFLIGDYETRSAADLKAMTTPGYAKHPTTEALCFAYAFDDEPVQIWIAGEPFPERVLLHVADGGTFVGHNVKFEMNIWEHTQGFFPMQPSQVSCTMARAYNMALPGKLEGVAEVLQLPFKKDMPGHRVMLSLAKPRKVDENGHITWWSKEDVPEKYEALYAYCKSDIDAQREAHLRLPELGAYERKIWQLDHEINRRGVGIDKESVGRALKVVDSEKLRLDGRIRQLTHNAVASVDAVAQLKEWFSVNGCPVDSVDKESIVKIMGNGKLLSTVREVAGIRQEAAKASVKKLQAMWDAAEADGRIRDTFQYYAANTGRWANWKVQFHNLRRGAAPEGFFEALEQGALDVFFPSPLGTISDSIRGFIVPAPGKEFIGADLSSIEARVLAWLAGQESVLDLFRKGEDIYKHAASAIFNVPVGMVTDAQRQIGKVAVLALGYGGGAKAFLSMAKNYNVDVPQKRAEEIKLAWRAANQKIVKYWYGCESAAINAIQSPGREIPFGPEGRQVRFLKSGSFLLCRLPSGRALSYPFPTVGEIDTPWGEKKTGITYSTVDSLTKKWGPCRTYGGSICENLTQATARDIMAEAMLRVEEKGYSLVLHVHDELVAEVEKETKATEEFLKLVTVIPRWATGLPVEAKAWRGIRYGK